MYLYLKLAMKLRERIQSGELKPGDPIPSGRDLSISEQMAIATVQKSINLLVDEGWLVTGKAGTFVKDQTSNSETTSDGFITVGEVVADDRRRIALTCAGVEPNDRFLVSQHDDGRLLLTPMVTMSRSVARRLALQHGVTEEEFLRGELIRRQSDERP